MSKIALPAAGAIAIGVAIAVGIIFWDSGEDERPGLPQASPAPVASGQAQPQAQSPAATTSSGSAATTVAQSPLATPVPSTPPTVSEPLPEVEKVVVPPVSMARIPENPLRPNLKAEDVNPKAGAIARALISDIRAGKTPYNPENLHSRAEQMRASGQLVDAHLLDFFSAREGYGPAAYSLAQAYDPVGYDAGTTIMDEPDAGQAAKWYRVARDAGVAAADRRLTSLHDWLKENIEKDGNTELGLLLKQWQ